MISGRSRVFLLAGLALLVVSQWAVAALPTQATLDFLNANPQNPDRRGMTHGERLVALYGGVFATDSDSGTTTDDFVEGLNGFLETNADAFGVDYVVLERVNKIIIRDGKYAVYTYRQKIEGLPVHGSVVKIPVLLGTTEKIGYVGIRLTQHPASALPGDVIDAAAAIAVVDNPSSGYWHLTFVSPQEAENVIYETGDGTLHRTWRFRGSDDDEAYLFFIDTSDSAVVDVVDQMFDAFDVDGAVTGYTTPCCHPGMPTWPDCCPSGLPDCCCEEDDVNYPVCAYSCCAADNPNTEDTLRYPVPIEVNGVQVSAIDNLDQVASEGFADQNGIYALNVSDPIPQGGVRIQSTLVGQWAAINNNPPAVCTDSACSEYFSEQASGENLVFNLPMGQSWPPPDDTSKVNAFTAVQDTHDWFAALQPGFMGINRRVTVYDGAETCNAKYAFGADPPNINYDNGCEPPSVCHQRDPGSAIPFYSNCNSSANATMISHEYGHFIQDSAGSGGEAPFKEGFADTVSSLMRDTACFGAAFFLTTDGDERPCGRNIDVPNVQRGEGLGRCVQDGTCSGDPMRQCSIDDDCEGYEICWQTGRCLGDSTQRCTADVDCDAFGPCVHRRWCEGDLTQQCLNDNNCAGRYERSLALSGAFWDLRKELLYCGGDTDVLCSTHGDCDFGACDAGNECEGGQSRSCTVDEDCNVGPCIDQAVEELFADFAFVTTGDLDESVVVEVLVADDIDADLMTGTPHYCEILCAFVGSADIDSCFGTGACQCQQEGHGWPCPGIPGDPNVTVLVKWEGPPAIDPDDEEIVWPLEGEDFAIIWELTPAHVVLKTTKKGGVRVRNWSIGCWDPDAANGQGAACSLGGIRAEWDAISDNDIIVRVGTDPLDTSIVCKNVGHIDIPAQDDANWSSVELNLNGGISGRAQCYATKALCVLGANHGAPCNDDDDCADPGTCDPGGDGGRISGTVGAGVKILRAEAIGVGNGLGPAGTLAVGGVLENTTLGSVPADCSITAGSISGYLRVNGELEANVDISGDMWGTMTIRGPGDSTGDINVDGNIFALIDITGEMRGNIHTNGYMRYDIDIHVNMHGDILADGNIGYAGTNPVSPDDDKGANIFIDGNMSGNIRADADYDGVGDFLEPDEATITITGVFSGDFCTAGLNVGDDPPSYFHAGTFDGTICGIGPVDAAGAPHDERKNRYITIDPSGTSPRPVALKVELTSMRRCSSQPSRACKVDDDCEAAVPGSGTCVEHDDVGTAGPWWVQAPRQEQLGCIPGPCGDEDWFARLDPVAHFDVWNLTTLHIGDCEIIPVATYRVTACLPPGGTVCGDPVVVGTIGQPFVSPGFRGNYGDVVGAVEGTPPDTYFTPPDGFTNVVDVSAYVLTKQNYGTPNKPQTHPTWVDLHGLGEGNPPQYILNVVDMGQIKRGFAGDAWTDDSGNFDPGQCPAGPGGFSAPGGIPVTFTLVADTVLIYPEPGVPVTVDVDVFVDSVADLGAYEVGLQVTGGTSGMLELQEVKIEKFCVGGPDDGEPCTTGSDCTTPGTCDPRSDYVFGQEAATDARSLTDMQLSNAKDTGGVSVQGQGYLATYTFQPSEGASGVFTIAVKDNYDQTFLNDSNGVLLASDGSETEVIGVGVDCLSDAHCEQIACQTGTCIDNACIYGNAAQGTPCDDGQFCTATDECDGNGACVGSGGPCGFPLQCCELSSSCICRTCSCLPE